MLKIVKIAIAANVVLASVFVYANFSLWTLVNAEPPFMIASHWSPLGISAPHYVIDSNGFASITQTVYMYFNTPFWIFWVLLVVNVYFMLKISKDTNRKAAKAVGN